MWVLTRRAEESLHIGPDIVLTVLGIKGNQVRLGISAPIDVVVDREEVHRRKQPPAPGHTAAPVTAAMGTHAGGISPTPDPLIASHGAL
jgi:carbon storage regulator